MAQNRESRVEITLSRDLGLFDITMIGIGAMIGAGIFVLMGAAKEVALSAAIVALALNGVVTFITAMTYAELGSCFPQAGGVYLWAREGLPAPAGFLSGWMSWTAAMIACSLYAAGFGGFVAYLLGPKQLGVLNTDFFLTTKVIAILIILFFTFINYWGAQATGKAEGVITVSKIIVLGTFVIAGLVQFIRDPTLPIAFMNDFVGSNFRVIFLAMGLTFVAFEGYEIIAQSGEEVKNPKKNIPRAIFISIIVAVILYVSVFYIVYPKLPSGGSETGILVAGQELLGFFGFMLMVVGGLLATTSALNATIYSSSRVSFAMGRDKVIPTSLGKVNEKRRTPANAVIISGVFIILMALLPTIEILAAAAGIMFLLLFLIANACLIALRKKRPDLDRGFRVPFVPVVPIIGMILNLGLAIGIWFLFYEEGVWSDGQIAWALALVWIVAGLAIHYPTGGRRAITEIDMEERKELLELLASEKIVLDKKIFRVLVPIADLENENLVRLGALLARNAGGELDILNVYEVPAATPPKSISFSMVDPRIRKMDKLERIARKEDAKVRSMIKIGHSPYQTILNSMEEGDVDILVLGWKGKPVSGRRILGSNIDHLIQRSRCDAIVFKTEGLPENLNKILVVSGHSWHATHAMGLAIQLAKEHGAEITILTIATDKSDELKDVEYSNRLMMMCEDSGIPHNMKVIHARSEVSGVVGESAKYDLVVLGATTQWVLRKYAFGRVTDQIAKKVDKPVLMFRKVLGKDD